MSHAGELQQLQSLDDRISMLRIEVASLEGALRSDPELDRLHGAAASAGGAMRAADDSAGAAEAEAAALQRRIRDLDRRLYGGSVRNPNELLEMQHELEALRLRFTDVEEHALALMERAEEAQGDASTADAEAHRREALRAEELVPMQQRLAAMQEDLASTLAQREALATAVDAADLALYTRVAARRRPAVVALAGEFCGGCHLPLSNEERRAVRTSDGLVQCANCDRILVT